MPSLLTVMGLTESWEEELICVFPLLSPSVWLNQFCHFIFAFLCCGDQGQGDGAELARVRTPRLQRWVFTHAFFLNLFFPIHLPAYPTIFHLPKHSPNDDSFSKTSVNVIYL
jgi:hypothetical protein